MAGCERVLIFPRAADLEIGDTAGWETCATMLMQEIELRSAALCHSGNTWRALQKAAELPSAKPRGTRHPAIKNNYILMLKRPDING